MPNVYSYSNLTWSGGQTINWNIASVLDLTQTGSQYDFLNVSQFLNIEANSQNPFNINVKGAGVSGFNKYISYFPFTLARTASGINGFSQSSFSITTTGFESTTPDLSNDYVPGRWSIDQVNNDLILTYSGVRYQAGATFGPVIMPLGIGVTTVSSPTETFSAIKSGYKDLNAEISALEPSTLINLYEIDLTEIYPNTLYLTQTGQPLYKGKLYIYNDYNLFRIADFKNGIIDWQGNSYYPFPIHAQGFELNSAGALPTPKVSIVNSSPDASLNSFYKYLRMQINNIGDLAGAKFTRIRTFLKYINGSNFPNGVNPFSKNDLIYEVELPRDIYFIDRKSQENKQLVEYTLASVLDVENLRLPSRTILATQCPLKYRGEGCCYEYDTRKTYLHSGIYGEVTGGINNINIILPLDAPPVATENDELFLGDIFTSATDRNNFSGINYVQTGHINSTELSNWSFANYTINPAFTTNTQRATALNDNDIATYVLTTNAGVQSYTQVIFNNPTEIRRINLGFTNTCTEDFTLMYSMNQGTNWHVSHDVSGWPFLIKAKGLAAGQYTFTMDRNDTNGKHTHWRLSTITATTGLNGIRYHRPTHEHIRLVDNLNGIGGTNISEIDFFAQTRIGDKGLWQLNQTYDRGNFVYLEKDGLKSYFVCISGHTSTNNNVPAGFNNPFTEWNRYWVTDECSKSIKSCRLRWTKNPYFKPVLWPCSRNGWNRKFMTGWYRLTVRANIPVRGTFLPWQPPPYYNVAEDLFPRRPDVHDPTSTDAYGIPRDISGEYLNTFLPFGGFPGTNRNINQN